MSKIVGRTLDFLEIFADQKRPLSLSEIVRLLGIPASSCHDVLQALLERGYIYEMTPRGGYYPTLRLYEIARTISEHDPVVLRADILLRKLRDSVDESVLLAKADGLQATYLLVFESSHRLRYRAQAGDDVRSLHSTSAGKALLGGLNKSALAAFLKSADLARLTPKTIVSKAGLETELAEGNTRGWFLNREESQEGIITLSARFVWISTTYIVSIAGPSNRMEQKLEKTAELLIEVCKQLEAPTGAVS
jgi:DNA-binding IclR family transcriptional regulator